MNEWQSIQSIRDSAGVTDERLERGPAWIRSYVRSMEQRLTEARSIADQLGTSIEPAPGVVEMSDRLNGATVRFRPGAIIRVYTDTVGRGWYIHPSRGDSFRLDAMTPDGYRAAVFSTGGVNNVQLRALED